MEALNQGPYAKLLPLNNGRYKRIVDPVPPKIFLDCQACCNCNLNDEELDLTSILSQQSYVTSKSFMSKDEDVETNDDLNSTRYAKLYTPQLADESTPSRMCSINSENSSMLELSETSEILQDLESHEERYERDLMDYDYMNEPSMVMRAGAGGITKPNWSGQERGFEDTSDEGIPILFYTKNRQKPALLMMVVDHKMQVIYMKRNKATRFFPIKLIDKIITSHQIIEEEFSKQIKHDPTARVNNMVLFNASNFTECVAIQFAEHSEKIKFINEVYTIKDSIKHGY